jgi:hypothetical protein
MRKWFQRHRAYWHAKAADSGRGTFEKAAILTTIIGAAPIWAALWYFDPYLRLLSMDAPTTIGGSILFGVILTLTSLSASWIIVFFWRICGSGSRLHAKSRSEIAQLSDQVIALQTRLTPKFTVEFDEGPNCFADIPAEGAPRRSLGAFAYCRAWWILLLVRNGTRTTIQGCVAHLISIHFRETIDLEYREVPYQQSGPLLMKDHGPMEILPSVPQGINVFAVDEIDNRIRILWRDQLQTNDAIFEKHGFYKLTVLVSSSNAGHLERALELEWRGVFERPRVRAL